MFQNAAIDLAIALILMYLLLSLLCTVINEFIATKLKLRAKSLASALEQLLDAKTLRDTFYRHGLIVTNKRAAATGPQSTVSGVSSVATVTASAVKTGASVVASRVRNMMSRPPASSPAAPPAPVPSTRTPSAREEHPSYLSGRSVALALIGSLDPSKPVPGMNDIQTAVENLPDSTIKDTLQSSLTEAGKDLDKFRTSIATWFDDSMERLSGAYKRQLKWISMLTGLIVAVAFNANSFEVATTLWSDSARRQAVVEFATKQAQEQAQASKDQKSVDVDGLQKQIKETEDKLRSLPIGWRCEGKGAIPTSPATQEQRSFGDYLLDYWNCAKTKYHTVTLVQVLGWIMTATALTLGAPFWFDLLQKVVNIRGAGAKPKREDEKAKA